MSDQDDSEKTEEPTQKKLDDARTKGQVATSREVNHWIMFVAMAVFLLGLAPPLANDISLAMIGFLESPHSVEITAKSLPIILAAALADVAMAIAPTAALFIVAAFLAGVLQNGMLFSPESIKPSLEKISPLAGIKRMFSMKSIAEFAKGILKLIIVGSIAAAVVMPEMAAVETLSGMAAGDLIGRLATVAVKLLLAVLAVMTAIAVADLLYQTWEHQKQNRMSRHDMKEEYKQTDGDPMIKQRLRQIRAERSRKRMIAEVPKADVIITNPTHFAVALKYDQMAMSAPTVIAKGADTAAFRIREVARENGVPIVENPPLARAIYASVDLDQEIPEEHYKAVAEVINYVWKAKGKRPAR